MYHIKQGLSSTVKVTLSPTLHTNNMPTLPVNNNGAVLYYEDSGAPSGKTEYSTIVIFHGLVFHGCTSSQTCSSLMS
jgi:hypothetical protein